MPATARRSDRPRVTIAKFDAFLDDIDRKGGDASVYELVDGEIVLITNPTRQDRLGQRHGVHVECRSVVGVVDEDRLALHRARSIG